MPGPPIRKPSDHSPPAGSPRNIAGHHVLHRPLMPRHPPNAQKNKQQNTRQNQETCRRNLTVRCSRPLYSSQPTHPHPPKTPRNGTLDGPGNPGRTAPEPRQHATPTRTKHAKRGAPTTTKHRQQRVCLLYQHGQASHTREQQTHETRPAAHLSARASPGRPRPPTAQTNKQPETPTPHITYP